MGKAHGLPLAPAARAVASRMSAGRLDRPFIPRAGTLPHAGPLLPPLN